MWNIMNYSTRVCCLDQFSLFRSSCYLCIKGADRGCRWTGMSCCVIFGWRWCGNHWYSGFWWGNIYFFFSNGVVATKDKTSVFFFVVVATFLLSFLLRILLCYIFYAHNGHLERIAKESREPLMTLLILENKNNVFFQVSLDNLHRQIAHTERNVGMSKVDSLENAIHRYFWLAHVT